MPPSWMHLVQLVQAARQSHRRFVDDFTGVPHNERDSQHAFGGIVDDYFATLRRSRIARARNDDA
jgi:hypothetical protein